MATAPVKSQPLHNFSLPFLKWGGTLNSNRFRRPNSPDHTSEPHRVGPRTSRNNRFALRPCSHDETDDEAGERKRDTTEEAEETVLQKPWNLRPRKPAGPVFVTGSKIGNGEVQEPVHSVAENGGGTKSIRLRGETTMQCGEKRKKEKFWIALSKEEIEEDIFVMTGSRPSRRPKKRPKIVQKQVDNVFPGLWLVGVTADAYKVAETPPKR